MAYAGSRVHDKRDAKAYNMCMSEYAMLQLAVAQTTSLQAGTNAYRQTCMRMLQSKA